MIFNKQYYNSFSFEYIRLNTLINLIHERAKYVLLHPRNNAVILKKPQAYLLATESLTLIVCFLPSRSIVKVAVSPTECL